jgi:hypothetical protein
MTGMDTTPATQPATDLVMTEAPTPPDTAIAWAKPPMADSDILWEQPVLMFAPWFLDSLDKWMAEHGAKARGASIWAVYAGGANRAGQLIKLSNYGHEHVWRLTGEQDKHGGYIGVWPD